MCQRCTDARIHCPGPISTTFIFVASPSRTNRKDARDQHSSPSQARDQPAATRPLNLPLTESLPQTPTSAILLNTFLRYLSHSARHSSWTFSLPSLSAGGTPLTHPLTSALHAVSLAHFANSTSDPVFSHHATLEYSRSLSLQRLSLAALPATTLIHASRKPHILEAVRYTLLSSTILSYYELIAATTPSAWLTHTLACEQLLSLLGPDIVGEDRILRQVAVSVRSHAVVRATVYGHATAFVQPAWLDAIRKWTTTQQQSVSRDAYDWVIEFILRLSRHCQSQHLRNHSDSRTAVDEIRGESPERFLEELQCNYTDWMMALNPPSASSDSSPPLFASLPLPRPPPSNSHAPTLPLPLQAQFPSMALAHFHAAAILLQYHLPQVCNAADPAWNCQWIMSTCAYLARSSRTNATAVLRMGLPFAIAWTFCPTDDEQQLHSGMRCMFEDWAAKEGMSGLSTVAFPAGL